MEKIIYGVSDIDTMMANKQDVFKTYTNFGELRQDIVNAYNNNKAVIIYSKDFGVLNYRFNGTATIDIYTSIIESSSIFRLCHTSITHANDLDTIITISQALYTYTFSNSSFRRTNLGGQGLTIDGIKCIIG